MFLLVLLTVHIVVARKPTCKEGEYRYDFTECDAAGGRWRVAVPIKTDCDVIGLIPVRQNDCSNFHVVVARKPTCKEGEYRYDFTECDAAGGRWRVAVPRKTDCDVFGLSPVRQKDCTSTCDSGQFLDVNSPDQKCKPCPVGHYSLGGEVTYTNWTTIPSVFETTSFDDSSYSQWSNSKNKGNCTNSLWKAKGNHLVSGYDACTSQLTLAVTLKKDGYVTFTYQSTSLEMMFSVYVRNEQCMMSFDAHSYSYPQTTRNFKWENNTVNLKRGHNLIVWEVALFPSKRPRQQQPEPVLVKSIEVHGVAYTSDCTPCHAGTYSKTEGTKRCTPCLADYSSSSEGAIACTKCNTQTEYSRPGSASCITKKPCTVNDYIEIHSDCDENNKFKKMFQWIEPKICRDDVNGATSLPVSGQVEECPPCNPGMYMNGTTCDFCPPMTYNDGKNKACTSCPASTEPEYGIDFHWWRSWPSNMERLCHSSHERGCASDHGFQLHGTYVDSGSGHADDASVLLYIKTGAMKTSTLNPGFGTITFEFQMECEGPCTLKFSQVLDENGKDQFDKLKQWDGKQGKQNFAFSPSSRNIKGFYWVFSKGSSSEKEANDVKEYKYRNDKVKIYAIKVTRTSEGGAAKCQDCPIGMKEEGCIPCPDGQRIIKDKNGKRSCESCPANTFLNVTDPYGDKACVPCGPGLHSTKGSTECVSSCQYTSKEGKSYNFKSASGYHSVKTSALFTTKGTKYYHQFNISFCQSDTKAKASCQSNVSAAQGYGVDQSYNSSICRLTIIPRSGADKALAAQPMSVGDQLMAIKARKVTEDDKIIGSEAIANSTVISFHYQSNHFTEACPQGMSSIVHLVCDPHHKEVKVDVPAKCSEGTCDGCIFHFIIHSSTACPLCATDDYEHVVTACVSGKKNTTYVWKIPRICEGGVELPKHNTTTCSILERSVKDFVIGLAIFAGFVLLMILAVLILWYKNRRLEYKYHKLIQNSTDKHGELAAAPQCVGDDDDEEEEVHFKGRGREGRGKRFLKNIKDKLSGEVKISEQYSFNNFSDDDIGAIEPSAKTPLS